jgi:predicted dithiol-disulfide oxidoreductase (DUF899 family)
MKKMPKSSMPRVVTRREWKAARDKLMVKEKALTRAHDRLAARRRRMGMVKVDKEYVFEGPSGKVSLLDLFEGRRQLVLYHFMFAPGVPGWPAAGCTGCSLVVDQFCNLAHLHARDTSFAMVSLAPPRRIDAYKRRMGWTVPWVSSRHNSFNADFGLSKKTYEVYGLSIFFRDERSAYHTYITQGRGVEMIGSVWSFLDLSPLGRQESWEDSPKGRPQGDPYTWWRRHDEY